MNHIIILTLILLLCGIFGGIVNFLRHASKDLMKSIFTGVAASALVPLLFKMMSSDLLSSSQSNSFDYFTIAGFCLTASIFSTKFIDSIGEKVFKEINKIDERVDKVETELQEVTTETEIVNSPEIILQINISQNEKMVLDKMYHSKYTYRSISGIAAEMNKPKDEVKQILESLEANGFLIKHERKNNRFRWSLTEKGREYIASGYGDEES